MIATAEITVADVEPRTIKEGTPDQRKIYDVVDREGTKWTAWEKDIAEQAWNLKGVACVAKVKVEQNGKYTNRTLLEISERGGESVPTTQVTKTFDDAVKGETKKDVDIIPEMTRKDEAIHRQTAAKVVAALVQSSDMTPQEFWENVEDLVLYFNTGLTPFGQQEAQAEAPGDDGIPF